MMKNKFFIVATLLAILSLFAVSYTFATTNAVNDVRNVVGGAENVIEDAGKGIVNGVKDGMNTVKNGAKDVQLKNGDVINPNAKEPEQQTRETRHRATFPSPRSWQTLMMKTWQ